MESASARTAATLLRLLPRERISRAIGHLTEARVPRAVLDPVLKVYSRAYKVDLEESVTPEGGFRSFNEFFTRQLHQGIRPVDPDPNAIVSPADGRLDDAGPIDDGRTFTVKGQRYSAADLLGSGDDAARYAGGRYAIVYLSPRDYHRVHSPLEGVVRKVRHLPGALYPVNEFGVKHVPQLFVRNERVVVFLETERFGTIAIVLVGAMVVGKITLAFEGPDRPPINGPVIERWYPEDRAIRREKGDEIGQFLLGSTVVLLLPPAPGGHTTIEPGVTGANVRYGQAIARRSDG